MGLIILFSKLGWGALWKVAKWLLEQDPVAANQVIQLWMGSLIGVMDQLLSRHKAQKYLSIILKLTSVSHLVPADLQSWWDKTDVVSPSYTCPSWKETSNSQPQMFAPFEKTMLKQKWKKRTIVLRPFSDPFLLFQLVDWVRKLALVCIVGKNWEPS